MDDFRPDESPVEEFNTAANAHEEYEHEFNFSNQPPVPEKPKNYAFRSVVASVVIAAIVGAACGIGSFVVIDSANKDVLPNNGATSSQPHQDENLNGNEPIKNIVVENPVESVVEAVYEKSGPSVVGIRTTTTVNNFFGSENAASEEGSGVVYSADGYIITNYHVIASAAGVTNSKKAKVDVFLPSDPKTAIPSTIVGYNIASDLAVIKIDKTGLTPIEQGSSAGLKVGQQVIAIGNPGGLQFMGSVSYGVISGLNRTLSVESLGEMSLIQTDAAINPGNSGGALVNTSGQLIGINSSKLVSESFEGMGFAIPVDTVLDICKRIIARESEPSPYIGIEISTRYDSETLQYLGYPNGAVVGGIVESGPASAAGIKRGDIITELNGVSITDYSHFNDTLATLKPGQKITAKIYRSGRYYSTNITVGANNAQ